MDVVFDIVLFSSIVGSIEVALEVVIGGSIEGSNWR